MLLLSTAALELAERLLREARTYLEKRGRWTVTELEKAVEDRVGKRFLDTWDYAWTLHLWGFHEARLDSGAVRDRSQDVKRIIEEAT